MLSYSYSRRLRNISYVINSGRRNGDNPFVKLPRHSGGEEIGGADGFDDHELRAIFKPESLIPAKRPSQFWTPLLALYTGVRLNELACLELSDFVEEKGIPCISIRYVPRAKPEARSPMQMQQAITEMYRRIRGGHVLEADAP